MDFWCTPLEDIIGKLLHDMYRKISNFVYTDLISTIASLNLYKVQLTDNLFEIGVHLGIRVCYIISTRCTPR